MLRRYHKADLSSRLGPRFSQSSLRRAMAVLTALLAAHTTIFAAHTATAQSTTSNTFAAAEISATDTPIAESSSANVDTSGDLKAATKPRPARGKDFVITPAREAAVFAFAQQYHPELVKLLKHLQDRPESKPYHRAIRELCHTSERLAALEKSDPERYKIALQAWQARSRVQLLSAKLSMSDREQLKRDLKTALTDQYDARTQLLELDRRRLGEKLARIETDLVDQATQRDAAIEKQLQTIAASGVAKASPANAAKQSTAKGAKRNTPATTSDTPPNTKSKPAKSPKNAE